MHNPNRILSVIIGTATMTMLALIPILNLINIFCCAGIIAGGFVGALSYSKQLQNSKIPLTTKDGGMIGILCGILSAIFVTGFGLLISLFSNTNPMLDVMKALDEMGFQTPPEMLKYIEKFSNEYNELGYSPTITIFSFVCNIILYPLFGSVGAILAVTLINKKKNQQA